MGYSTYSSKRTPSYTDRILYTSNEPRVSVNPELPYQFETDVIRFSFSTSDFTTDDHFGSTPPTPNYPIPPKIPHYKSLEFYFSDHIPVTALVELKVPVIQPHQKKEFENLLLLKLTEMRNINLPKVEIEPAVLTIENSKDATLVIKNVSSIWVHWKFAMIPDGIETSKQSGDILVDKTNSVTMRCPHSLGTKDHLAIIELQDQSTICVEISLSDNLLQSRASRIAPSIQSKSSENLKKENEKIDESNE